MFGALSTQQKLASQANAFSIQGTPQRTAKGERRHRPQISSLSSMSAHGPEMPRVTRFRAGPQRGRKPAQRRPRATSRTSTWVPLPPLPPLAPLQPQPEAPRARRRPRRRQSRWSSPEQRRAAVAWQMHGICMGRCMRAWYMLCMVHAVHVRLLFPSADSNLLSTPAPASECACTPAAREGGWGGGGRAGGGRRGHEALITEGGFI